MARIVADVESLTELSGVFERQSGAVADVLDTVTGQLQSTAWEGPAADRFHSAWDGEFRPALQQLEQALQDAANELRQRIDAFNQIG